MENNAITPQVITEVSKLEPEKISDLSEQVLDATKLGNQTIEELEHLSSCLSDFSRTQERYAETAKLVKSQMRQINNHL